MISIVDFMEYDEVRAILGLSSFELPDETLALGVYQRALSKGLRSVSGEYDGVKGVNLLTVFDDLAVIASPTDAEEEYLDMIKQFALYTVAAQALSGIDLTAMKAVTDGKSSETRFSSEKICNDVAAKIYSELSSVKDWLSLKLGVPNVTLPYLSRVAPATDRVSG